jgi:arylsulfatase A-like enzyme
MPDRHKANLLFLLTDQQRRDALSCMGSRFVQTPNMDRLATEGVRFTNAITPSPICVPARTAILTGLPIHSAGCITNLDLANGPRDGVTSFDDLLAGNGYAAEYIGRWHAPTSLLKCYPREPILEPMSVRYRAYLARHGYKPLGKGEHHPYVSELSGQPYEPDPMDHLFRVAADGHGHNRVEPGLPYGRDTVAPEHSLSAMIADQTIEAIERLKDAPFSLTSSFLFPHNPLIVPSTYCDMVAETDMEIPATFDDDRHNTQYANFTWHMDDVERRHARLTMARYYAATQEADYHIGRVLDALDRLGLTDNTLVIFTSDHGEMLGDHGLMTKFVHYREAVGVPLLMRMPGRIGPGHSVDAPVCLTDLYATIADYLLVSPSDPRGESLRPRIDGDDSGRDPIVFSQFEHWNVMAQTRDWKYVWSKLPSDVDMLFNLADDPAETVNLLGSNPNRGRYLDHAIAMKTRLVDWMRQTRHPWLEQAAATDVR